MALVCEKGRTSHKPRAQARKIWLAFCLLLVIASQVSCGRQQALTLCLAGDEWFLDSLTKTGMIPVFERQSGIRVEVLHQNDRAIMAALDHPPSSKRPPLDIIVVRHRLLGMLVEKNQVQPIEAFLSDPSLHNSRFHPQKQLFADWWQELSSYGNHIYGYPFTGLTAYLCYRKDLLEDPANQHKFEARYHRKLAPPVTWQEYMQLAEFFNRPQEHFYGTYIQGKQGLALWYEWLNYIYSYGGNILNTKHGWETGDVVVNSPQNVAATEQYVKLIQYSPPDTLKFGWGEAQSSLQEGHVFMGILWSDQAPFLEDPKVSNVAGKIGYSLIPSANGSPFSQMEGLTYLIPSESQHPREAYKFLEWAMSAQVQTAQTLHGSDSLRMSTYNDPQVKSLPYTTAFLKSIPVARAKPTIPQSPQMTEAMEQHLFEIISGHTTAQEGLDQLAIELRHILGDKVQLRYPVKRSH